MKFYYNVVSTYSQKAMIALYEKEIAFEPVVVDLASAEGKADYAKLYPIGKVPLLKPSDDHMIPESSIIIEYLEGHFPQGPRLIPEDTDAARQVRFMDRMSDLYLDNPGITLMFEKIGFAKFSESELAKANRYIQISYEQMNQRLAQQEWLCGEFSMADCAAIPPLFYLQHTVPYDAYPHVVSYYERARQRPSYARVLAELMPVWERMMQRAKQN